VALTLSLHLIHSRVGRALRSIHGNEEASNALGINAAKYKLSVFVFSAALAAIGGAFATHYNGGIGPSESAVIKSVRYVAIVAVGGMSNLWGVLFMGLLLNFLSLRGYFGTYDDAVFGVILIAIMLFAPQGVLRAAFFQDIRKRIAGAPGKPRQIRTRLRLPAWVMDLAGRALPGRRRSRGEAGGE
jgi:branched-chain amino acid transport system permease protein